VAEVAAEEPAAEPANVTWLAALAATLLLLAVLTRLARARAGRAPGVPEILMEPPEEIHPAELAVLWGSFRRSSPLLAALGMFDPWTQRALFQTELLHLAHEGVIEMEAVGRVTEPEDLRVTLRKQPEPTDRGFVDYLFAGGKESRTLREVAASSNASAFSSWAMGLRTRTMTSMVATQVRGVGRPSMSMGGMIAWALHTFVPLSRLSRGWAARLAGTGAMVGAVVSGVTAPSGPGTVLLPAICLGAGLIAVRLMPYQPPAAFRVRLARWASFRRFLVSHADLDDAPALAVTIWERYLVYASALQAAEEVQGQVRRVVPLSQLVIPWLGAPSGAAGVAWVQSVGAASPKGKVTALRVLGG
jgi:hypothetical protein